MPFILSPPTLALRFRQNNGPTPIRGSSYTSHPLALLPFLYSFFEGQEHGLIDNWLRHIKDVYRWHKNEIDAQPTEQAKLNMLCEKNVIEQVANVCHSTIVQHAWKENKDLTVHGWIYSIKNGLLKALDAEAISGSR